MLYLSCSFDAFFKKKMVLRFKIDCNLTNKYEIFRKKNADLSRPIFVWSINE